MAVWRYRLQNPTLALLEEEGRHVAQTIPTGAVVAVEGVFDGENLVEILWDGKKMMMFVQDLRSRADLAE